jgi:hypothetical protein
MKAMQKERFRLIQALPGWIWSFLLLAPFMLPIPTLAQATLGKPIWRGNSAGYQVQWTTADLVALPPAGGKPLFSARAMALKDFAEVDPQGKSGCEQSRELSVLSLVGTIVSYQQADDVSCPGTAHPAAQTRYQSLNLARPAQPPLLTDLFSEASVLKSLLAEPTIRAALRDLNPAKLPSTTRQLVALLTQWSGACDYSFPKDLLSRFAFHHLEGGNVAVRIGLSHGCEAMRGKLYPLGILLPIPKAMRLPLMKAQSRQAGFLMKDQRRISQQKVTVFAVSPK